MHFTKHIKYMHQDKNTTSKTLICVFTRYSFYLIVDSASLNVMIHYKVARNVPIDLYFLHDASKSMENLITNLTQVTNDIGIYTNFDLKKVI